MTYALSTFRVWVMPGYIAGEAFYYQWALANFVHEPRLIPERVSTRPGGMGSASFRWLRAWRDEGSGLIYDAGYANVGCYIAVTAGVTNFDRAAVIFWGYIDRVDVTEVANGVDKTGSVNALGLGYLMDGTQLSGFRQAVAAGASEAIDTPPTFNLQGDGGVIVGNKVDDSSGTPAFSTLPSGCSATNLFSRLDVLDHVLTYCLPPGMPSMLTTGSSAVTTYLSSIVAKEVFDLDSATLKGAVDLLVSRSNGFGWDLRPNASDGWDVFVYPLIDDAAVYDSAYPVATPTHINVTSAAAETVAYTESASDLWDSVTVNGDNIVVAATVSFADSNLVKGWTASQETAYRAGATADPGYASLTTEQEIARNEQVRNASSVKDVFQLFTLNLASASITRSVTPGTGGATLPLVPEITWDGTTAAVGTGYATPYLPTALFARSVPWLVGVTGNGTDLRDATLKARPKYLEPKAFKYDVSAATGENVCQDLDTPANTRPSPTITPDDRTPGLRISYNPQEILALGSWTDGTDGIARIFPVNADPYARPFNYSKLALTVGIGSDQRVSVTLNRYGVPEGRQRRILSITDDTIQCWVALAGTIVGSKIDGSADRVAVNTFIRNDFPTAQRLAAMYAAFAFRRRSSLNITLAQPDYLPAWAVVGTMIGQVTEVAAAGPYPAAVTDSYTVVEALDYGLTGGRPRVTVSTTLPSPPSSKGGGGASPASGGTVSQTLGGTVAQAASANQSEIAKVAQRTASVPTSIGREGTAAAADGSSLRETITQANTFTAGQVVYNNAGAWALARANAVVTARYTGVVESATTTSFVVVYAGVIGIVLTPGTTYYLSDLTAGLMVVRATVAANELLIPVVRAVSATEAIVMPSRDSSGDIEALRVGSIAAGGGTLRCTFAAGKYFSIDSTGNIDFFHSAAARVQIDTAGKVTCTYTNANTVTIDPANIVGTNRAFQIRELDICDSAGVAKKIQLICTAAY